MPIQRQVTIAAGAGYTNILATMPCHYLKVIENGDRTHGLTYKVPEDSFAATFVTKAGDTIERIGHGRSGILGRPPNYNASGVPATGDILLKITSTDAAGCVVDITESENEL